MSDGLVSAPTSSAATNPNLSPILNVLFAWGVWALLLGTNLVVVYRYSPRSMPMSDELQELGGGADLSVRWLWEQHAEHRIPLAKLIWLGTLRTSNYDFRVGNLVEVAVVGLVALLLMVGARRIRGKTRWTDAFFPLVLLNLGQTYPVFLWWWQVNHTLPPLLACLFLLIIAKSPFLKTGDLLLGAILLVLLSVSGPGGLPYVPPLALWLCWTALRGPSTHEPHGKRVAFVVIGLAGIAVGLVAFYFRGFDQNMRALPPAEFTRAGVESALRTSIQLLSVSLGTTTIDQWKLWGGFAVAFWFGGGVAALAAVIGKPAERSRALGLFLFLCGSGALVLVMGWARANYDLTNTFEGHYLTKGVPALCCVYFLFEICCGTRAAGELQACLFGAVLIPCLLLVAGGKTILTWADRRYHATIQMNADLDSGMSAYVWHQIHDSFHGNQEENPYTVAQQLYHLRDLGVCAFVNLRNEKELPISPEPIRTGQISRLDGALEMTGDDPSMIYQLDRPRHVVALIIRITYLNPTPQRPARLQLYWKNGDQDFSEKRSFGLNIEANGNEQTVAIPIDATIDSLRLDPDSRPGRFTISEMMLLVPDPAYMSNQ